MQENKIMMNLSHSTFKCCIPLFCQLLIITLTISFQHFFVDKYINMWKAVKA